MFPDRGLSVNGSKHLTEKVTAAASLTRGLFKKNTNYSYAVRISISLAILSEIFIQIGYFFWELCKKI